MAARETLIPVSSRVSLLVGEEHQIDLLLPDPHGRLPLDAVKTPSEPAGNERE